MSTQRQTSTQRQIKILVADDDNDLRELVAESFRGQGYAVEEVSDGEELRGRLEAGFKEDNLPDLVLTDHVMPRLTGLEVLAWAACKKVQIPFVIISAFSAPQVAKRGRELGALRVFSKPVDLQELSSWVAKTLGTDRSEREADGKQRLAVGQYGNANGTDGPGNAQFSPESAAPPTQPGTPPFWG